MFSGIVQSVGELRAVETRAGDVRMHIHSTAPEVRALKPGDSIAVNGCCLTVIDKLPDGFSVDASRETLELTTLGTLRSGARLNLESAMSLSTPLGGHLVSGHVDGVGSVRARSQDARSVRIQIEAPAELSRYIARKGSICVDGVSLTVNSVAASGFEVNIIPHTLEHTILGEYQHGTRVNLEVDLIARYLERLLDTQGTDGHRR
ncbi:MAG: riboflavin synthase [Gammaproteobacteria bacterium]|nr:riboflavin synthase [Gammaproteobacteria bacterium]MDE2345181.1 riboflavin synthase [Gammaproteobacteria bacterium]